MVSPRDPFFEATHEANPEALEWELPEQGYSNPEALEWAGEWENHETHFSNPESLYSNPEALEWEDEGELFFKKAFSAIKKVAGPLAKKLAPIAARTLVGMIPGVGAVAGPLAGKLVGALVREGEQEAAALEAHLLSPEAVLESGSPAAHEAALAELLAAEAAEAASLPEAEAVIAASLPLTITIMGGRRALRHVTPALTQANARLVQVLGSQGPAGRQLLRAVPEINRLGVGILKAQARRNQPITSSGAVRAMAVATQRVLSNPQRVQQVIGRNAAIRQRVAPASPRRANVFAPGRAAGLSPARAGAPRCRCGAPIRA
jgi:hypothetical protein